MLALVLACLLNAGGTWMQCIQVRIQIFIQWRAKIALVFVWHGRLLTLSQVERPQVEMN